MTTPETTLDNSPSKETLTDEEIFANTTHRETIETVIASLEDNDSAMVSQTEQGYVWKFQYGSVEVYVQLTGESDEDLLNVWANVLKMPVRDELGLMRRLLEMNCTCTFETCFGLMNDQIVVLAQRTVAELSPGEIARAITLVANIADDYDEVLKAEFGGN